jgi:hypothetical protein
MNINHLDLQNLRLGSREIESLSGLEVSDRWIGGILGGVYRFSQLHHLVDWLGWLLFEGIVAVLLFVFTLPIGLALSHLGSSEAQGTLIMLSSMGASTFLGMLLWNGYMVRQGRSLRSFMHLLDEIERYHDVLDAVAILEQLQSVQDRPPQPASRLETLQSGCGLKNRANSAGPTRTEIADGGGTFTIGAQPHNPPGPGTPRAGCGIFSTARSGTPNWAGGSRRISKVFSTLERQPCKKDRI